MDPGHSNLEKRAPDYRTSYSLDEDFENYMESAALPAQPFPNGDGEKLYTEAQMRMAFDAGAMVEHDYRGPRAREQSQGCGHIFDIAALRKKLQSLYPGGPPATTEWHRARVQTMDAVIETVEAWIANLQMPPEITQGNKHEP